MRERSKRVLLNLVIILAPVMIIMLLLTSGATDTSTLGTWDLAISIGAMITVLIFLLKDKRR